MRLSVTVSATETTIETSSIMRQPGAPPSGRIRTAQRGATSAVDVRPSTSRVRSSRSGSAGVHQLKKECDRALSSVWKMFTSEIYPADRSRSLCPSALPIPDGEARDFVSAPHRTSSHDR